MTHRFFSSLLFFSWLPALLCGHFHFQELESKMTPQELQASGIKKLSPKEKTYLETWLIRKHHQYQISIPKAKNDEPVKWTYIAKKRKPYKRKYDPRLYDEAKIPYNLAIFSLFQHESKYLREWIEYHKLLGVEHFYLYNNLSNDNYHKVLAPYIKRGEVTLVQWPYYDPDGAAPYFWCEMQKRAYENAMDKARGKYRWMAFIDTDEFLVPMKHNTILDFLNGYEAYGGVIVNWVIFGTSYVDTIGPGELMIDKLVMRALDSNQENNKVKSIVKPHRVEWWPSPHWCEYQPGYFAVDSNHSKAPVRSQYNDARPMDLIRLHHYWYRDASFYWNVKVPRWRKTAWQLTDKEFQWREYEGNKIWDPTIRYFVPQLQQRMRKHHDTKNS